MDSYLPLLCVQTAMQLQWKDAARCNVGLLNVQEVWNNLQNDIIRNNDFDVPTLLFVK